jgi:Flp pilus assembly protein TadD
MMKKVIPLNISLKQLNVKKFDEHYYNTQGVEKADRGRFKEASEYFSKAIELDPKDSKSYFNRASVKMRLGDILGARSDFKLSEIYGLNY